MTEILFGEFKSAIKAEAAKKAERVANAKPRGAIPINSAAKLGCLACPNDALGDRMDSPKLTPQGATDPLVYLLWPRPMDLDDKRGEVFGSSYAKHVLARLDPDLYDESRVGYLVQCYDVPGEGSYKIAELETTCCRPRAVDDIMASKPKVVVGIGDEVLHWATGLARNAIPFRGTFMPAKFGTHVCWFYPVLQPNYIMRKNAREKSEYEYLMEHDLDVLKQRIHTLPPARVLGDYDRGIEKITGMEGGDMQRLEEALHWALSLPRSAFDIETNMLKPHNARGAAILTCALGTFERTVAFPVAHTDGWGTESRVKRVYGLLGEYIAQSGPKVAHNVGFEMDWLAWFYGREILRRTEWEDTMAMSYAFDERKSTKSLDVQTRIEFGFNLKDQSPVDVSRTEWWKYYSLDEVLRYNGMDTKWCDLLADLRLKQLADDSRARSVYETRLRTAPTLVLLTDQGLPVNFEYARDLVGTLDEKLAAVTRKLQACSEIKQYGKLWGEFEPANTDHVMRLMDELLNREEIVDVKDGKEVKSVDEEHLSLIPAAEVPSAKLILDYRTLDRNKTGYLTPLLARKLTGVDGKIHSEYQSMHTSTGRLNSSIHNWPKHKHKEVRGVVQAEKGEWVVAFDYGQIEYRVGGMMSEDEAIIKGLWNGFDVHKHWAGRILDLYPKQKDALIAEFDIVDWDEKNVGLKTARQVAKNGWVFPMMFGSEPPGCAHRCFIPLDVSKRLGEEFWSEYKAHRRWQKKMVEDYHRNLYVETLGGYRRHGAMTVNELINMPIQGTAAEICIEGMNALSELADRDGIPHRHPAFNGHDDLTFFIPDHDLEPSIKVIGEEMCKPRFDYINCPLIVEVSVGTQWDKLEEVEKISSEVVYSIPNPYR